MLVLLIIFMVAAPMLQRGVEVNLPVARRADKMTEASGSTSRCPLSYRKDRRVYLDDEAVPIDVLAERMRQAMHGRDDKQVYLRADGEVQLQELLDVIDRLKEGGIEKVGIVALERPGRHAVRRWMPSAKSCRARARQDDGLSSMLGASALAHVVLVGVVVVRARGAGSAPRPSRPRR